jgi:NAD(P)-dependent dehydrogenase (short-subunit alcohol dehydrogenase family)
MNNATTGVALITGASRGIGKACAVQMARAGFDVALTARTVADGEAREHSSTVARSDMRPLPGSLMATAALVEAEGRRSLMVAADLLDRDALGAAVATVFDTWGRIDVLVNNGRYVGPGHMDQLLDTPIEIIDAHLQANVIAPLVLTKLVLPAMIERGTGLVVNITSGVAMIDPPAAAGQGGWGLGYATSKGALHRVAGVLHAELAGTGVRIVNLDPGYIATERIAMDMAGFGFDAATGDPPDVVGVALAWLATAPEAAALDVTYVAAKDLCADRNLLPGWERLSG